MPDASRAPVVLLWTGGFDSTFRLLELMDEGRTVQPYYIVDLQRRSYPLELQQIGVLRETILKRFDPADRLLPIKIRMRSDYPPDPDILAAWDELRADVHVGEQYPWLAQFCRAEGFPPGSVEMSMDRREPPSALNMAMFEDPYSHEPTLKPGAPRTLFGCYRLGLISLTKAEMAECAAERGWLDILAHTWFCHAPIAGRPCGHCSPCKIARANRTEVRYSPLAPVVGAGRRARRLLRRIAGLHRPGSRRQARNASVN